MLRPFRRSFDGEEERIERPEKDVDMTLCIAAVAREVDKHYAVVCFDRRIETEEAGSETGYKLRKLPNGWGAMLAGEIGRAEELLNIYITRLGSALGAPGHYVQELRQPAFAMKTRLIEQYVQSLYGMSHHEFMVAGSQGHIPENIFVEATYEIGKIEIGCQLILFLVDAKTTRLFSVDMDCSVNIASQFCAIGTGARSATAWLHFREQNQSMPLGETLYQCYEAKKFAENAPGVGKQTRVMYVGSDDEFATMVDHKAYEALWRRFRPRITKGAEVLTFESMKGAFTRLKWTDVETDDD